MISNERIADLYEKHHNAQRVHSPWPLAARALPRSIALVRGDGVHNIFVVMPAHEGRVFTARRARSSSERSV
jgi:hypothetical protein